MTELFMFGIFFRIANEKRAITDIVASLSVVI